MLQGLVSGVQCDRGESLAASNTPKAEGRLEVDRFGRLNVQIALKCTAPCILLPSRQVGVGFKFLII